MYEIEAYKANSLLSQALSHNAKLVLKMKDLEAICQESKTVAATSRQRSPALEDITRASGMAEKEASSRMQEIETRLMNIEQKYIELEQQMNLALLGRSDADRELTEYSEKTSQLILKPKSAEEKLQEQGGIMEQVTARNSELHFLDESETKDLYQKVKSLEDRELIYQERVNDVAKRVALARVKLANNEPSAETNLKLKRQLEINELQKQLNASAHTRMNMTEQLMKNFAPFRNQLLRDGVVNSKVQSRLRSFISSVEDWNIRPTVLEMQPKISEEYANVAVAVAESDTVEFSCVGDKYSTFDTLEQQWLFIPAEHKECYLVYLLNKTSEITSMVFTRTCEATGLLALILQNLGLKVIIISDQMSQANRLGALNEFKAGECNILICTDVASRGLDIPPVDLVINYDIPCLHEVYIHRVGRAARAGVAILLVSENEVYDFSQIEKLIGKELPIISLAEEREQILLLLKHVIEAKISYLKKNMESGEDEDNRMDMELQKPKM